MDISKKRTVGPVCISKQLGFCTNRGVSKVLFIFITSNRNSNQKRKRVELKMDEIYAECQKTHSHLAGKTTDGCQAYKGETNKKFNNYCDVCKCHLNFHRQLAVVYTTCKKAHDWKNPNSVDGCQEFEPISVPTAAAHEASTRRRLLMQTLKGCVNIILFFRMCFHVIQVFFLSLQFNVLSALSPVFCFRINDWRKTQHACGDPSFDFGVDG